MVAADRHALRTVSSRPEDAPPSRRGVAVPDLLPLPRGAFDARRTERITPAIPLGPGERVMSWLTLVCTPASDAQK
jgi:hypothetical protein